MNFTLCLTHDCNLRCAYCYAGRKQVRRMAWETARRGIDFGLEHSLHRAQLTGRPPTAQLGYFGGEPLLEWPLLQRSAEYAIAESARRGVRLLKTVTTNMTLLDTERTAWFRANGFCLGLSLDGNPAMHDTLRRFPGGRGSHAECAKALPLFRGIDPGAEVIVVVDPRTITLLVDSVEWLLAEDIRYIALNPNFYIDWPTSALAVWRSAYARIGKFYVERFRQNAPVSINAFDGKIRTRLNEGYAACEKCGFGDNEIAIAASGNIYPCERIVGDDTNTELCIGNVFDGFDQAKRTRIAGCRGNTVAECAECPLRDRCMNWCSCINYATTGAVNRVHGIVCFHERLAIEVADQAAAALFAEKNPAFLARFYSP